MPTDYIDEGDPVHMCEYCSALLWYNERIERYKDRDGLQFAPCCSNGKSRSPCSKNHHLCLDHYSSIRIPMTQEISSQTFEHTITCSLSHQWVGKLIQQSMQGAKDRIPL